MIIRHQGIIQGANDYFSEKLGNLVEQPSDLTKWGNVPKTLCNVQANIAPHSVAYYYRTFKYQGYYLIQKWLQDFIIMK